MRKKHVYDSSYVYHYVLSRFYLFEILDISKLCFMFDYHETTFYKMFDKINCELALINPDYEIIRLDIKKYKMVKIE